MPASQMSKVIQHLHDAVFVQEASDGKLLEYFVTRHEQAALEVLVRRHGPMVWGVCHRILGNHHDAEDAFQATFLVLIRKAASIAPTEMVGNWLYGVAHQTALKARTTAAKRKKRECQVTTMPETSVKDQEIWSDLQPFLDRELSRLPDKYRVVILLCDLEGRTQKEAARRIDCPEGTVATRLARGRELLAKRMARHGLAVSGGSLAAALAQNASACMPASVVPSTIKAVTLFAAGQGAMISVKAIALTEGVLKTMLLTKLKIAMAAVLIVSLIAAGGTLITGQMLAAQQGQPENAADGGRDRVIAQDKGKDNPAADKEKPQGVWTGTELWGAGKKDPDAKAQSLRFEFKGDTITITIKNEKPIKGTFTVDPKKSPATIDLVYEIDGKETKFPAIYELKGDVLKICGPYAEFGERPTAFVSSASTTVLTLKKMTSNGDRNEPGAGTEKKDRDSGGGEKLQDVKAWIFTQKQTKDGRTTTYRRCFQVPDRFRTEGEIELDGKQLSKWVIVINGDKGWSVFDGKAKEMSAEEIASGKTGAFWVSAPILGPKLLSDPASKVTKLPEFKIGDRVAVGFTLTRKEYGTHRLYLDKQNGRLIKIEQDYKTDDGKSGVTQEVMSDFREVGGIMVPHKRTIQDGGKVVGEWAMTDYKFFDKLDAKLFEQPTQRANQPAFEVEFLAIKKEAEAKQATLFASFEKENAAAKTEAERTAAFMRAAQKSSEIMAPAARMVLTAVRPHAADPAAAEVLVWVVNSSRGSNLAAEAADLLKKHHLTDKRTIELANGHWRAPEMWTESLLRAQRSAPDLPQSDKPRVLYALAVTMQTKSQLPIKLAQMTDEERSHWEGVYGKETFAGFRKIDVARAEAEAIKLYTELNEKYGSEKLVRDRTFGGLAKSAVFEIQNLSVGKTAPEIHGKDTDGVTFKLSDYRGKVVLLSFWSTWCGPCMQLVPHEREMVKRLKDQPFALIGVNSDVDKTKLTAAMGKAGITWRSFWCEEKGTDGDIPSAWNVTAWPTIYVLDHNGVIRAKEVTGKSLDRVIDELIREVNAKK